MGSPPSLSELTPMIFNTRLTHLGSEASICLACVISNDFFQASSIQLKKCSVSITRLPGKHLERYSSLRDEALPGVESRNVDRAKKVDHEVCDKSLDEKRGSDVSKIVLFFGNH